jgi:hypothetical protein
LYDIGGADLLANKCNNSLSLLLSKVYPEYEWLPWKFVKCPQNFWNDVKNQRQFMDWAAKELKVNELSDWYNVSLKVHQICFISS